jgi:hypothetical protein
LALPTNHSEETKSTESTIFSSEQEEPQQEQKMSESGQQPIRKGRGKAKRKKPLSAPYSLLVEVEHLKKLEDLAVRSGLPVSHFVRTAIKHYLATVRM